MIASLTRPRFLALAALCLLHTACFPTLFLNSPHVSGRVTDARTHSPVAAATVGFPTRSGPVTVTDVHGLFDLAATHELELEFLFILPGDRFDRFTLQATHPRYSTYTRSLPPRVDRPLEIQLVPSSQ